MAAETLPRKVELHEVPRMFFWGRGVGVVVCFHHQEPNQIEKHS